MDLRWIVMAVGWAWALEAGMSGEKTNVFESPIPPAPAGRIDALTFARLRASGIEPVDCSDAVFIRRVYLDVLGILPGIEEVRQFLADPDRSGKRRALIDRVLARDEYADYWALRWGDVLRIKAEYPVNLWPNAVQAYHRWVRNAMARNMPYDRFARELLTSSGSNFRVGPVNFYRAVANRTPEGIACAVALTFLGSRAEAWPTNRLAGLAEFFSQLGYKPTGEWKEEHVFWDPTRSSALPGNSAPGRAELTDVRPTGNPAATNVAEPPRARPRVAIAPDGLRIPLPADRDPREVFADWLLGRGNRWFVRSAVNRMWAWLLGRGVVHEPDDLREDNRPEDPALLDYLEREFIAGGYDLKQLCRLILNSKTYQISPLLRLDLPGGGCAGIGYRVRRLDAEVLIDAINRISGSTDLYTSPIPEPFTFIPEGQPAVALPDGSITSPFLALFGRPARATGMASERSNKPMPAQWLHLLNSAHIQRKLEQGPRLRALYDARRPTREILETLYLTLLSRYPTPDEIATVDVYGRTASSQGSVDAKSGPVGRTNSKALARKRREEWMDIAWSMVNSTEFLYRH
jgi:hypothetical protein